MPRLKIDLIMSSIKSRNLKQKVTENHVDKNDYSRVNKKSHVSNEERVELNTPIKAAAAASQSTSTKFRDASKSSQVTPVKTAMSVFMTGSGKQVSPSSLKIKYGSTKVWHVTDVEGKTIATAIEGAGIYAFSKFFQGNMSTHQLSMLTPYAGSSISEIEAIPIPGKLFKAQKLKEELLQNLVEAKLLSNELSTSALVAELKQVAPYIVSATGKEEGNTQVWLFTTLQLFELHGYHQNFKEMVHDAIISFLDKAHRPSKRHTTSDGHIELPEDIETEAAMEMYDSGTPFEYEIHEYQADSDHKMDVFSEIAYSI